MPKKWVRGGLNPEGTAFFVQVDVPRSNNRKVPEPPPNFTPLDEEKFTVKPPATSGNKTAVQHERSPQKSVPVTWISHVSEALDAKND